MNKDAILTRIFVVIIVSAGFLPMVLANNVTVGFDDSTVPRVVLQPLPGLGQTNFSLVNVNNSLYWMGADTLGDIDIWVNETGDEMTGDLVMANTSKFVGNVTDTDCPNNQVKMGDGTCREFKICNLLDIKCSSGGTGLEANYLLFNETTNNWTQQNATQQLIYEKGELGSGIHILNFTAFWHYNPTQPSFRQERVKIFDDSYFTFVDANGDFSGIIGTAPMGYNHSLSSKGFMIYGGAPTTNPLNNTPISFASLEKNLHLKFKGGLTGIRPNGTLSWITLEENGGGTPNVWSFDGGDLNVSGNVTIQENITVMADSLIEGQLTVRSGNGRIISTNGAGSIIVETESGEAGAVSFGNTADIGISRDGVEGTWDSDGTFIFKQKTSNPDSIAEFVWIEENNNWRFALPSSGSNYGTYNPRSMIIAGPSVNNASNFECTFWKFANLNCDTSGFGADLGVQHDIEYLGHLYGNSSSFTNNMLIEDGNLTIQSPAVGGSPHIFMQDGSGATARMFTDGDKFDFVIDSDADINLSTPNNDRVFVKDFEVQRNISMADSLFHLGNVKTYINYITDGININAGGSRFLEILNSPIGGGVKFVANPDLNDIDYIVRGLNDYKLIYANAGTDEVGIGLKDNPLGKKFAVNGSMDVSNTSHAFEYNLFSNSIHFDHRLTADGYATWEGRVPCSSFQCYEAVYDGSVKYIEYGIDLTGTGTWNHTLRINDANIGGTGHEVSADDFHRITFEKGEINFTAGDDIAIYADEKSGSASDSMGIEVGVWYEVKG